MDSIASTSYHQAVILLGSNLGHREAMLAQATEQLPNRQTYLINQSNIYESEACSFDAPNFLNQVIVLQTKMQPDDLLTHMLHIESQIGRSREPRSGYVSRIIDIDLLYYDRLIINLPHLIIPHPRLHQRRFALIPLVEVLPDFVHPVLNQTHRELVDQLQDSGRISLFRPLP